MKPKQTLQAQKAQREMRAWRKLAIERTQELNSIVPLSIPYTCERDYKIGQTINVRLAKPFRLLR